MAYAEVRSNYMEDSVKKCSKEVLVDALGDVTAERRGLGRLLDVLIAMAQVSSLECCFSSNYIVALTRSPHTIVGTLSSSFSIL